MQTPFYLKTINGIKLIKNKRLDALGVAHFFTTRVGGVSTGAYASLNTGRNTQDKPNHIIKNTKKISAVFGTTKIYAPQQVHSDKIIVVTDKNKQTVNDTKADALITALPKVAIAVKVADCVGLVLYGTDKTGQHKVIATIHSGWRGVANKITSKTIAVMKKRFGVDPKTISAGISPAIGPCCYEVGQEIYKLKKQKVFNGIFNKKNGKIYMNLWKASSQLLEAAGVKKEKIFINDICTACNPKLFYSHRRDKGKTGRMLTGIKLI